MRICFTGLLSDRFPSCRSFVPCEGIFQGVLLFPCDWHEFLPLYEDLLHGFTFPIVGHIAGQVFKANARDNVVLFLGAWHGCLPWCQSLFHDWQLALRPSCGLLEQGRGYVSPYDLPTICHIWWTVYNAGFCFNLGVGFSAAAPFSVLVIALCHCVGVCFTVWFPDSWPSRVRVFRCRCEFQCDSCSPPRGDV